MNDVGIRGKWFIGRGAKALARINIKVNNVDNYYSRIIKSNLVGLYRSCVSNLSKGVLNTKGHVEDVESLTREDLDTISVAILHGCPELFYVSPKVNWRFEGDTIVMSFESNYKLEDVPKLYEMLLAEIERIGAKIDAIETEYDKIMRLNAYLCRRTKLKISNDKHLGDACGALLYKEAYCGGFSKAAKLILDRSGIQSFVALGIGDSDGGSVEHGWNIVYCDGKPYHFDFTWNAGFAEFGIPGLCYTFLSDKTNEVDHHPNYRYPACDDDSKEFWNLHNGVVEYVSDIAKVKPVQMGKSYVALVKFGRPLTKEEHDHDINEWGYNELNGNSFGSIIHSMYSEALNVVVYHFINE